MHPTHCRYCNRALSPLERYSGYCSAPACKERHLKAKLEAFRDEAAQVASEPRPDRFHIVVVPHRAGQLVAITPEQRQEMENHLIELSATGAIQPQAPVPEPEDAPAPIPAICGTCQGVCCYHGGQHMAFLDEETIGRFAAQHPDVPADHIPQAYLQHLPDQHFEDSCLFHTGAGCNLPRTIRAAICNRYECRGLKLAREQNVGSHDPLFIVVRHDNEIVRGEFVEDSASRVVNRR